MIDKVLAKPIEEVLANKKSLPKSVLASRRFKAKKEEYINAELQGMSSQDVVDNFTQIPSYMRESETFKKKIENLPSSKKSERRMLKNVKECLRLLREAGTHEANEQRRIITSALYDPRWGFPAVNETRTVKNDAKDLQSNLRGGVS